MKRLAAPFALMGLASLVVMAACGGATATPTPKSTPAPPIKAPATPIVSPTPTPATSTPPAPQPKYGSTLKASLLSDPANWDAYDSRGGLSAVVALEGALSNLVVSDAEKPSLILPDLAERWQQSGDGKTVTFFIRRGVKWHNGRNLVAEDVAWNIDRGRKAEGTTTNLKTRFAAVESVAAPDDFTVRLNLKRPSASALPNLAVILNLIYPPFGPAPNSPEFKQGGAIGTGPFKFKSYTEGQKFEFVRSDNYYKKDEAGRTLPYLDGLALFVIPKADAALAAWRAKQIDCGCIFDNTYMTPAADQLRREFPDAKLVGANTAQHQLLFNQRGPLTDPRVRRAIFVALDRLTIRNLFQGGIGKAHYPPGIMLSPTLGGAWGLPDEEILKTPGFRVKDAKKDPADLELAQQLFREAGVDPKSISLVLAGSPSVLDWYELYQATLANIGVNVTLKIAGSGAELISILQRGDFDIHLLAGGNVFDDPSDQPARYLLSTAPENYGKWQLPKLDTLFERMEGELDPGKRLQLAYEFQRAAFEYAVASPSVYLYTINGPHRYVFGWVKGSYTTNSGQRFDRVWIDESLR